MFAQLGFKGEKIRVLKVERGEKDETLRGLGLGC